MVLPVNVSWLGQTPQHWNTYLPQEDDYETTDDYLKAVADASRAYYEDAKPIGQYWDPIGQVTRGGAQTEVEQGLRKLQDKFRNIGKDPLNSMGMESWIRNNEQYARAAYGAFDELGNPVLDRAVLALIERVLGIEGAPPSPAAPAPDPVPGAGRTVTPPNEVIGVGGGHDANGNRIVVTVPAAEQPGIPPDYRIGSDGNYWQQQPDGSWVNRGDTIVMGDTKPQGPPGTNGPQQEAQPLAAGAPTTSNLMAQFGIAPPAQVATEPNSGLYPDFILQRLNARRKGVQYGQPPMPKVGY